MAASMIAAQLYTLRDFLKTPADIAASLKKVKQIGYESVQLSGLGKIDARELNKILQGEGLSVCATHVSLESLKEGAQGILDEHRLWNCKYTAIGMYNADTAAKWEAFAADFSKIATSFAAAGLKIGYHNHSHELARFDGKTAMQILLDKFSQDVWMEIDTYWITHGGADPIAWINKVAGRIPCVHFKDMGISADRKQFMAEVGEGNLNWPGIIDACRKAGVQWYIVEQDVCQRDPFESLAISLRNLRQLGVK